MYIQECEQCGKERKLKSVPKTGLCRSCAAKLACKMYPNRGWNVVNEEVRNGKRNNGFLGKKHSKSTKEKLKKTDRSYTKTLDFKQKISDSTKGNKNPMYGKKFYDIWVDKYGVYIANEKEEKRREKLSKRLSGKNNPMYGKPSPQGSGNGWSGWYKGWFFRSIYELSYMVLVIERFNIEWDSAENQNLSIKYELDGKDKTYQADFIIAKKYLVEIKPTKLKNTKINSLKRIAAQKFCECKGLKYKMTNCRKLNYEEILNLKNNGKLIFTERYEEKFRNIKK